MSKSALPLFSRPLFAIALLAPAPLLAVEEAEKVSYYKHVRPVFQAKCQGCHQPAKQKGDYVMTEVAKLIAGGESGEAVVAHQPDESFLVELITPIDGEVEMPPKGDALSGEEIALVKRWIAEGAIDDTPDNARTKYDRDRPPVYAVPPVVTSLDYSPDGKVLAMAGFHEVLLHNADGSGAIGRLIGLSERIESVRFSPDGKRLAVAGGLPGRMGEVQIWDVAKQELLLSAPVGYDTAYGVNWSPDGKLVSFGLPDATTRAIEASSGKQVLFMGGHSDWVLDTVFSKEGSHLVSVGRDMSAKLTEVGTERFVDNITSITPGALKGGILAVDRHPSGDQILVGGSDGVPKIYRIFRETARRIGDDANLIRQLPGMEGRIWSVAYSGDGKKVAAASSLNGHGRINVYETAFDSAIPEIVKKAFGQVASRRTPEQKQAVEDYYTADVSLLASVEVDEAGMFSVAFSPDGKTVAASGEDGRIRLIDAASGEIRKAFVPVEVDPAKAAELAAGMVVPDEPVDLKTGKHSELGQDALPAGRRVVGLEMSPSAIELSGPLDYRQMLVTAMLDNGDTADVTRIVQWQVSEPAVKVDATGLLRYGQAGNAKVSVNFEGKSAAVEVRALAAASDFKPDFVQHVNPVISRLGCNMGTCHGAKDGKNGFKLSLRGYDPLFDVRAFGDDHTARRVNYASPDDSLMLLKATGGVPHEGGALTDPQSSYYNLIRAWIANGAKLKLDSPRVASIEILPKNPVIQQIGARQQMRVVATYTDGEVRDVTREAFVESANGDVAKHDDFGLIATMRRGEAPILARFEGAYAATTVTVMGDREGFTWKEPETRNRIDELVAAKWQRMKIQPSGLASDSEFFRRVYLDLTGLPPTPDRVQAFLADERPTQVKRDAVIDELIGSPEFVEHWTNKWADMLQVNSKFLAKEGAQAFRQWIRDHVEKNTPYDQFVREIITAKGSNKDNPAASYYKILRTPEDLVENTTHLFLTTRFNCNKCHDHPFERWTQDQYYETAAYFAQVDLKPDAKNSGKRTVAGSAVEKAKPLYEIVEDKVEGELTHDRTGVVAPPAFPYETEYAKPKDRSRRQELAAWMTSPENRYFASSYANRIWGYLMGTGIIEPLDDIRASNPPSNPELLAHLTDQFVKSGFDVRSLMREICQSRTYQLSIESNNWNADDEINFSHAKARRLPAEVIYDSIYRVTGAATKIPGVKPGTRAAELADSKIDLPSGFLANLGRPARESACECDRTNDVQLGSVMSLLSGPAVADAIADPDNAIAKLVRAESDDRKLIEAIYLRVLNRHPAKGEIEAALEAFGQIEADHDQLVERLAGKESERVPIRAELEKKRLLAIQKAEASIEAYRPEFEKKKAAAEAEQKQRVAAAEKAVKDYQAEESKRFAEWERALPLSRSWTVWEPLAPKEVKASGGIELKVQDGGSILASGPSKPSDYTVTFGSKLSGITGVLLEVLPHDSLSGFGPGLNKDGNFVVTELELQWAGAAEPEKLTKVKFADAKANFTQNGFDVKNAINGNLARNDKGWAISGSPTGTGTPHWARFQLEKPIGDAKGATYQLKLVNRYSNGDYPLGHFRLWVTRSQDVLEQGLPSAVANALRVAPGSRNEQQKALVLDYYRAQESQLLKLQHAVVREQRPLPGDPKMADLQGALARAQRPIPEDPGLVQLRRDVEMSIAQAADRRLTGAQDLTWALINNPAFLFNH